MAYINDQLAHIINNIELSSSQNELYENSNLPKKSPYIDLIWREKDITLLESKVLKWKTYILWIEGTWWIWKTSLVYWLSKKLIENKSISFLIWVSAKEEDFLDKKEFINTNLKNLDDFLTIWLRVFWEANIATLNLNEKKEKFIYYLSRKGTQDKRILIVIDNLETIKDNNLFNFIKSLDEQPWDFYIITTSRIKRGLVDNPIEIEKLNDRDIGEIIELYLKDFWIEKDIDKNYLAKLCKWNPLVARACVYRLKHYSFEIIKKELENNNNTFSKSLIDYFFWNIYNSLSFDERVILHLINLLWWNISSFEISLISKELNKDSLNFEEIIHSINKTSFIHVDFDANGSNIWIWNIEIDSLLYSFLKNKLNDDYKIDNKVNWILRSIKVEREKTTAQNERYKQTALSYWAENENEIACCRFCINAQTEIKNGFFNEASWLIKEAEKYSDSFPFLSLVKAQLKSKIWSISEAKQLHEKAIHDSKYNPHYCISYQNFLLSKNVKDFKRAYEMSLKILEKDSDNLWQIYNKALYLSNIWSYWKAIDSALEWVEKYNLLYINHDREKENYEKLLEILIINYNRLWNITESSRYVEELEIINPSNDKLNKHKKIISTKNSFFIDMNVQTDNQKKCASLVKQTIKDFKKNIITYDKAIDNLNTAKEIDSTLNYLNYWFFKVNVIKRNHSLSLNYINDCIKNEPNNQFFIQEKINLLRSMWNYTEANNLNELLYSNFPDNLFAIHLKWIFYSKELNDLDKCLFEYLKWYELYQKYDSENKKKHEYSYKKILEWLLFVYSKYWDSDNQIFYQNKLKEIDPYNKYFLWKSDEV